MVSLPLVAVSASEAVSVSDADTALAPAGYTALHVAAEHGHADVCWLLLAGGANYKAVIFGDSGNRMAMMTAESLCRQVINHTGPMLCRLLVTALLC